MVLTCPVLQHHQFKRAIECARGRAVAQRFQLARVQSQCFQGVLRRAASQARRVLGVLRADDLSPPALEEVHQDAAVGGATLCTTTRHPQEGGQAHARPGVWRVGRHDWHTARRRQEEQSTHDWRWAHAQAGQALRRLAHD